MKMPEALARSARVFTAGGMTTDQVPGQVMRVEARLGVGPDGEVTPLTADNTPFSVAEGHSALDYLIAEVLDAVPVHMYRSRGAWALRHSALPHRVNQHPVGHPVPAARVLTLEEGLGMEMKPEPTQPPKPRTLEEKLLMRPPVRSVELDDLSRRLGRAD
jgi:hypothetical protein